MSDGYGRSPVHTRGNDASTQAIQTPRLHTNNKDESMSVVVVQNIDRYISPQ